jgi:hypothetical protein
MMFQGLIRPRARRDIGAADGLISLAMLHCTSQMTLSNVMQSRKTS